MIGVVLAGGSSSRFGGRPKGLLKLGETPLVLRAAHVLTQFCAPVVIEAAPGAGYESLNFPLVHAASEHAGKGPLAGIAAGLALASGRELLAHSDPRVAFAPCDMPNLTPAVYKRIAKVEAPGAYASTSTGFEPLVAVLSGGMRPTLLDALAQAVLPRTHSILNAAGARVVAFGDADVFANVNTPEDLAKLEAFVPPEPTDAFFGFVGRLTRVVATLDPTEMCGRGVRQAMPLLQLIEPTVTEELRSMLRTVISFENQPERLNAYDEAVLAPAWRAAIGVNTIDFYFLGLMRDLIPPSRTMDDYEIGEVAVALARLGNSESALIAIYERVYPEVRNMPDVDRKRKS